MMVRLSFTLLPACGIHSLMFEFLSGPRVSYKFQKGYRRSLHRARLECCVEAPGVRIPIDDAGQILPELREDGGVVSPILSPGIYVLASCPAASTRDDLTTRTYFVISGEAASLVEESEVASFLKSRMSMDGRVTVILSEIAALERQIATDKGILLSTQKSLSERGLKLSKLREELKRS